MKTKIGMVTFLLISFILLSFGSIVSATVPELSNPYPTDTLTGVDVLQSSVNVTVYDLETKFNWTIQGTYITNTGANDESNGSKTANLITPLPFSTVITWYVNVSDNATTDWTNATYTFTTRSQARLSEHTTDPSQILLVSVLVTVLMLGLVIYVMKSFKDKTFKFETFIKVLIAVIVISIAVSFL